MHYQLELVRIRLYKTKTNSTWRLSIISLCLLVHPFPEYEILLNVQCVLFFPLEMHTVVDLTSLLIPCLHTGTERF